MNIGICAFSFTRAVRDAGLLPDPLDAYGLMQMAVDKGLTGVEFPSGCLPATTDTELARCRDRLRELGLSVTVSAGRVDGEELRKTIPLAKALGARSVRTVLSGILEGDRSKPPGPQWQEYLGELVGVLKEVRGLAEDAGITVAVENHQDATSDDLLRLCEQVSSPMVGVTLDTGNALAVAECPLAFARKVAPYVKNVHVKDYRVHLTGSGYRLVRCAIGDGAMPFRELFGLLKGRAPDATLNIELGATKARHIRLLEDSFWDYYPPRSAKEAVGALRVAQRSARPQDEDWRTPHERGESARACAEYELGQFRRSVENLEGILA